MSSSVTKKQHYVWRVYLAAWERKNKIYCLRDGGIFPSNLMGITQERYFYRLQELNAKEREFIRQFAIQESHGALRVLSNKSYIDLSAYKEKHLLNYY